MNSTETLLIIGAKAMTLATDDCVSAVHSIGRMPARLVGYTGSNPVLRTKGLIGGKAPKPIKISLKDKSREPDVMEPLNPLGPLWRSLDVSLQGEVRDQQSLQNSAAQFNSGSPYQHRQRVQRQRGAILDQFTTGC